MNSDMRLLESLANRVQHGEREAAARLSQLVAPHMVYIVRRALRRGSGASVLDRRILAEAERALADDPDRPGPGEDLDEGLVRQIAQRLCDRLAREGDQPPAALTRCLGETVLV